MALASLAVVGSTFAALAPRPSQAADPEGISARPPTWDMSQAELQELGLGQTRDYPVPVPDHLPRFNVEPRPTAGGVIPPWIVFLNFDGATLTGGGDSAQDNITQIGELVGVFAPFGDNPSLRGAIIQGVKVDFLEYNIDVVSTRPAGGEYAMTMVGPTNPFGGGVLGIAPVDCGNTQTHSNISFAFHGANDSDAATAAATISHEQGHAFGLDHVNETADILNPFNAGGDPTFMDACLPLSDGFGAICSFVHEQYCPQGSGQNGHLELLSLFGPAIPDVDGPVVLVTAPLTGTIYEPGDGFTVIVTIIDDSEVVRAELFSNGMPVMVDVSPPWGWQINNVQAGLYTLEVLATDEHGNEGLSTPISILVGGTAAGGSGGVDDGDSDGTLDGTGSAGGETETAGADDDAEGCGCTQAGAPGRPWLTALPLLALLGLRRRAR